MLPPPKPVGPPSCAATTSQHRAVVAVDTNKNICAVRLSDRSPPQRYTNHGYPHLYVAASKTGGAPLMCSDHLAAPCSSRRRYEQKHLRRPAQRPITAAALHQSRVSPPLCCRLQNRWGPPHVQRPPRSTVQ